jgi:hypothetical protein
MAIVQRFLRPSLALVVGLIMTAISPARAEDMNGADLTAPVVEQNLPIELTGTLQKVRESGVITIGYRDAVTLGTTNATAMQTLNDRYKLGIKIVSAPDHEQSYEMLEAGKADAFATDDVLLSGFIASKHAEATNMAHQRGLVLQPTPTGELLNLPPSLQLTEVWRSLGLDAD